VNDILELDRAGLRARMRDGHAIDPAALDDWEYRGISLGLPAIVERLTWKTFKKVFHRDPATGKLRGWNMRLEQHGVDGPVRPLLRRGRPITFGHFEVVSAAGCAPSDLARGLLIDYRSERGPLSCLRDPIVALEPGSADRLLGFSYLELAGAKLPTPSYFLLLRDVPLGQTVAAP
jgi:hypothetical protein